MFYRILKVYARLVLPLVVVDWKINRPELLQVKGPVLFAANHPSSFLDGILLTTLCEEPLYSLARGDVFQNKWTNRLLRQLQLLPVYRTSEGVENLEQNYITFSACLEAFRHQHLVLIFSEGRCENEWHLRPLKKGTARLAMSARRQGIPLTVIPLGFNYSSFKQFGKAVHLHFGQPILQAQIEKEMSDGQQHLRFNNLLQQELQELVYEIDEDDKERQQAFFPRQRGVLMWVLLPVGVLGLLLHAPLLLVCTAVAEIWFKRSGHYDSVQTSLFLLGWLPYIIVVTLALFAWQPAWAWLTPFVFYLTAFAAVRVKYHFGL